MSTIDFLLAGLENQAKDGVYKDSSMSMHIDVKEAQTELAELREKLRVSNALAAKYSDAAQVSPKDLTELREDRKRLDVVEQLLRGGYHVNTFFKREGLADAGAFCGVEFRDPEDYDDQSYEGNSLRAAIDNAIRAESK